MPQNRDKSAHLARIVELPFFGGLYLEETAEVVQISPATTGREWTTGRHCLHHAISGGAWTPERRQRIKEVLATTLDLALADRAAAYDRCYPVPE